MTSSVVMEPARKRKGEKQRGEGKREAERKDARTRTRKSEKLCQRERKSGRKKGRGRETWRTGRPGRPSKTSGIYTLISITDGGQAPVFVFRGDISPCSLCDLLKLVI